MFRLGVSGHCSQILKEFKRDSSLLVPRPESYPARSDSSAAPAIQQCDSIAHDSDLRPNIASICSCEEIHQDFNQTTHEIILEDHHLGAHAPKP
jgi:hypothetical protein